MPAEHRCPQCHQVFPVHSKLQRHLETHMITGDWLCGLCNTLCNRFSALNQHWRHSCPEMKSIFCPVELKSMPSEDLRETAFRLTLERFCFEKDSETPGTSKETAGVSFSLSSFCVYCNLHLPYGSLDHHYGVHTHRTHVSQCCPDSSSPFICDLCGFGFRYKKSLINHWRQKCEELHAELPSEGLLIDNRHLAKMVENLVRRAEIVAPALIENNRKDDYREENNGDDDCEDIDPGFSSQLIPSQIFDLQEWNVSGDEDIQHCVNCSKKFYSAGRLKIHINSVHLNEKPHTVCELCQSKFTRSNVFLTHLRVACKAMKIEVPDDNTRKKMSKAELFEVVKNAENRWKKFFAKKINQNLEFIQEFLSNLDKKNHRTIRESEPNTSSEASETTERYSVHQDQIAVLCEICKINFTSPRYLSRHQEVAHPREQRPSTSTRSQITVTSSSLVPFFRLKEATFYDNSGNKYCIGKYLDKSSDLAKHIKVVATGSKLTDLEEQEYYAVDILGEEKKMVLLKEDELFKLCQPFGRLKAVFNANPLEFEDLPELEVQ